MKKTHAKLSAPHKLAFRSETVVVLQPAQLGHAVGASVMAGCTQTNPSEK